jgi:hypothetical protein
VLALAYDNLLFLEARLKGDESQLPALSIKNNDKQRTAVIGCRKTTVNSGL